MCAYLPLQCRYTHVHVHLVFKLWYYVSVNVLHFIRDLRKPKLSFKAVG